jgi:sugar (pentulose or hexulose) kinase
VRNKDQEVVIGLDSSTTATKAIAWRRDGSVAGSGRAPIPLASLGNNRYEQNPEDWWNSTCAALQELFRQVDPTAVAAIAISNQRETFVSLDENGNAVRPAIIWLDQRCSDEVAWLADRVGRDWIHRITGKPPDMGPVVYRMAWMLRHEPELFRRTALFADVHGYLVGRLTGAFRTSQASADPLGLLDMERQVWSPEILLTLGLSQEQLPEPVLPGSIVGEVNRIAAAATGLAVGTLVVAGGGDGQAAGLGVNAIGGGRAYLNLGTAVVSGVYSKHYRIGQAWRTMGSCTGEGYYYETSLRTGAFLTDWFAHEICGAKNQADIYQRLESEAASVPLGSAGLLALPYWGAVMTPYWDAKARGCFVGLIASHGRGNLYRALLEGIALEQALVSEMIERETGESVAEYIAIGGGAASDLWCQILADATGKTIRRSATIEASSLGVAICAAVAAGWFADYRQAAREMCDSRLRETEPLPGNHERYLELGQIYRELYPTLRETFHRLAAFRHQRVENLYSQSK